MRNFCDCTHDGFCPRYGREMVGRMREVCAGVNVDLGTAAAFRAQWQREARPAPSAVEPQRLVLQTRQAPGDAVAMTAAIYSLHRAHPGGYVTAVESYWPDVFAHNPDVAGHAFPSMGPGLRMHYPAIHQSNERGIHFMQGWCEHLGAALGIDVPLLTNRPCLYFPAGPAPAREDFWLVCSGGKRDFTNKAWGRHNYQAVVSSLKGRVRFVQVGGSRPPVPWRTGEQVDEHPPLRDLCGFAVGKTSLRNLFDLVRRARGVLCGVSLLMHVAAALERPAVVVAGGREPVAWNAYPMQQYVHTVGMLPCRDALGKAGGACWRSRTVPLGDGSHLDQDLCEYPLATASGAAQPRCMAMIEPEQVAALIVRYNGIT